jgi:hypothetical protein
MSSNLASARRRLHAGRLRRVAVSAVAVAVGAIILSGCVVIQSESALQGNVIGNTVTVTTVFCASSKTAAAPCNVVGNYQSASNPNAGYAVGSSGTLLVGYRIPIGVAAPATITTTAPSTDKDGNVITATITFTQSPSYSAGLSALVPPPPGTAWVGYESTPGAYSTTPGLPQAISLAPTFTLPPGFTGNFTWRTVVGFRDNNFAGKPVSCPTPFPGVTPPTVLPSVCIDFPDPGTIVTAPPNALQVADLSITAPATPTVAAGSAATLVFTGLFTGGNPLNAVFAVGVSTTLPGVTPTVTPTLLPGPNSSNPLSVSLTVPSSTPPGTYDVTVGATVLGQSRSGTGHITVKAAATATTSGSGKAAKLSASVKKTTLKAARKTGIPLTFTLSKTSAISVVALQTKPKVSVTVRKTLKAGKKTVVLVKSKKLHRGKVTITFKGGGVTRVITTTLR